MLSVSEIASLRAIVREACPSTAELRRPSRVNMEGGGIDRSGPEVSQGTDVCSFSTRISQTALIGDAQRLEADAVVTFAGDTTLDIRESDRLVVDGVKYEAQGTLAQVDPYKISKQVLVSRV